MEIRDLQIHLPYRIDRDTIAVLSHVIKNGNQKFCQTIYGSRNSNISGIVSNEIPESMYRLFSNRISFKPCLYNPVYLIPEKASLVINGNPIYTYVDLELERLVESSIDGLSFKSTHSKIEELSNINDPLDLVSMVAPLNLPSILNLIQELECLV